MHKYISKLGSRLESYQSSERASGAGCVGLKFTFSLRPVLSHWNTMGKVAAWCAENSNCRPSSSKCADWMQTNYAACAVNLIHLVLHFWAQVKAILNLGFHSLAFVGIWYSDRPLIISASFPQRFLEGLQEHHLQTSRLLMWRIQIHHAELDKSNSTVLVY